MNTGLKVCILGISHPLARIGAQVSALHLPFTGRLARGLRAKDSLGFGPFCRFTLKSAGRLIGHGHSA